MQKIGVFKTLGGSFSFLFKAPPVFWVFVGLSAALSVFAPETQNVFNFSQDVGSELISLGYTLLFNLVLLVSFAAITAAALEHLRGNRPAFAATALAALRATPALVLMLVLTFGGVVVLLLSVAALVSAQAGVFAVVALPLIVWIIGALYVLIPVALEQNGHPRAIWRTWALTRGNRGRIVAVLIGIVLIFLVSLLINLLLSLAIVSAFPQSLQPLTTAISFILTGLANAVLIASTALIYLDLAKDPAEAF